MAETPGRRIKCNGQLDGDKHCNKTLAVVLDDGTVDFKRERSRIVTTGRDYAQLITCAWCSHKTALIVKDGKLEEHGLEFKTDEPPKPDDKPNKEGDTDGGTKEDAGKAGEQEPGTEAGAPASSEGGEEPAGADAGATPDPEGAGAASDAGDGSEGGSGGPDEPAGAKPDPEPKPAAKPKPKRSHLRKTAARG